MSSTSKTIQYCPPASRKRSFIAHYSSTLSGQGLTLGLGVLTGILSARMLGPAGRGEYAAIIIWPMGIAGFLAFGISQAIVFCIGQREIAVSAGATALLVIGSIQSAVSVAIGLLVVPLVLAKYSAEARHLGILFVLLTPALIFGGYPANLFQGVQNLLLFNFIRLIAPFSYAAALLGLYLTHRGSLSSVIASQLAGGVLALVIGSALAWRVLRLRMQWSTSSIPRLFHFGLRLQGLSVATFVNQRIDQLVLSLFVPPQQLGFYAVAVALSSAVGVFPQAAGIVAFSRGSSQHSGGARTTAGLAFRASLIWLLGSCTLLYALAPFLIRLVFGSQFDGSILACRILLPGTLMTGLNFVLYSAAGALGRPGLTFYPEAVGVIVTAAGLYFLVPPYGYLGAAVVSSVAYTTSFVVMLMLARKRLGLNLSVLLIGALTDPEAGITL